MYPILFKIGSLTIYSYGAMLALAIVVCSFLLQKEAKQKGINPDFIFDLVFWVAIFGILGSRIFFVFLNISYFIDHPFEIIMIYKGGLAWQGGLILGSLAGFLFIKRKKEPLLQVIDLVAPYIALGQAIGRLGCFLNGCCYGKEAQWGIFFPVHSAKLQPTQLYSFASLLAIFFTLKYFQKKNIAPGTVFILYFILSSTQRFFIQFVRADYDPIFLNLGIFQIINICIILVATYGYAYLNRR
ncbi:MAG: prolipoprotein diacylglyceryl transferase [Candidatus Omnitrophica bacterium]|nr:prolipoprotein diacylglyceryl transferase [Candidatus Omnitrophota bacterium]